MVIRRPLGHVTRNYLTAVPHLGTIILPCPWGWHCLNPVPPTRYRVGSGVNGVDASRLALLYVGRMGRPVLDLTIVTVVMFFPLWLDPFARFFPRFSCAPVTEPVFSFLPVLPIDSVLVFRFFQPLNEVALLFVVEGL
jgi:hypothetical protein